MNTIQISNKEIGERINKERIAAGMTQTDLAKAVGVAVSTIGRYESGSFKDIKLPIIKSIALALHINPVWLMGYETDKKVQHEDSVLYKVAEDKSYIDRLMPLIDTMAESQRQRLLEYAEFILRKKE